MDLDPRRLLVLRAVALRGGVGEAARLLNLTASAVSQQLSQLERETGLALLDRSQRRASLTPAGQLLAVRAERIHRELEEAERELASAGRRLTGPAVIAAFSSVIRHLVAPAIPILAGSHPGLAPRVVELEGPPALRELRTGGVDLVVAEWDAGLPEPRHPGLAPVHLADEEYRLVIPSGWKPVPRTIRDLAARPWITGPPEMASGRALERLAQRHRFTPLRTHVCIEHPSVLALVAAGLGAAVLPALALGQEYREQVRVLPIALEGSRRLSAWHRATGQGPEPLAAAWIAALAEVARARLG
jgi:DNA-binding transcriptional LysR family regulator